MMVQICDGFISLKKQQLITTGIMEGVSFNFVVIRVLHTLYISYLLRSETCFTVAYFSE